MPKVPVYTLTDPEAAALREARARYGTYPEVAAELGMGARTLEYWLQATNRRPVPKSKLLLLLWTLLSFDPALDREWRFVFVGEGRRLLDSASRAVYDEDVRTKLLRRSGVSLETLRAPVGPDEARARGHVAGVVKSAAA